MNGEKCLKRGKSVFPDGSDGCFELCGIFEGFLSEGVIAVFPKELVLTVRSVREIGECLVGCSVVRAICVGVCKDFGVAVAPLAFVIPLDVVPW